MSGISPSSHAGEHLLWAREYCANCLPRRERRKKKKKEEETGGRWREKQHQDTKETVQNRQMEARGGWKDPETRGDRKQGLNKVLKGRGKVGGIQSARTRQRTRYSILRISRANMRARWFGVKLKTTKLSAGDDEKGKVPWYIQCIFLHPVAVKIKPE